MGCTDIVPFVKRMRIQSFISLQLSIHPYPDTHFKTSCDNFAGCHQPHALTQWWHSIRTNLVFENLACCLHGLEFEALTLWLLLYYLSHTQKESSWWTTGSFHNAGLFNFFDSENRNAHLTLIIKLLETEWVYCTWETSFFLPVHRFIEQNWALIIWYHSCWLLIYILFDEGSHHLEVSVIFGMWSESVTSFCQATAELPFKKKAYLLHATA